MFVGCYMGRDGLCGDCLDGVVCVLNGRPSHPLRFRWWLDLVLRLGVGHHLLPSRMSGTSRQRAHRPPSLRCPPWPVDVPPIPPTWLPAAPGALTSRRGGSGVGSQVPARRASGQTKPSSNRPSEGVRRQPTRRYQVVNQTISLRAWVCWLIMTQVTCQGDAKNSGLVPN